MTAELVQTAGVFGTIGQCISRVLNERIANRRCSPPERLQVSDATKIGLLHSKFQIELRNPYTDKSAP